MAAEKRGLHLVSIWGVKTNMEPLRGVQNRGTETATHDQKSGQLKEEDKDTLQLAEGPWWVEHPILQKNVTFQPRRQVKGHDNSQAEARHRTRRRRGGRGWWRGETLSSSRNDTDGCVHTQVKHALWGWPAKWDWEWAHKSCCQHQRKADRTQEHLEASTPPSTHSFIYTHRETRPEEVEHCVNDLYHLWGHARVCVCLFETDMST